MALNDYARLVVFMDANALTQVTSLSMTTNSGQQRVDVLNEGLAGFTPGAGDTEVEVGYAVPLAGPEAEYQQNCATGAYVTMQICVGKLAYIGRGKILTNKISQTTNQSVEGTTTWLGELKAME